MNVVLVGCELEGLPPAAILTIGTGTRSLQVTDQPQERMLVIYPEKPLLQSHCLLPEATDDFVVLSLV
jgi:hypothetical protein